MEFFSLYVYIRYRRRVTRFFGQLDEVYIQLWIKIIMEYSNNDRLILLDNQDYIDEYVIEVIASFYGSND